MKAKFLPLLLLAILLQVSMFSFANEMTSARRIRLKNKTEVQHRSIPVTPDACIENSLLSIDLLSTVPTVTVIILKRHCPSSMIIIKSGLNLVLCILQMLLR